MITHRLFLFVALALCLTEGTYGFMPTKKKSTDRRTSFSNGEEDNQASPASTHMQYQPATPPTAAFSVPSAAMIAAAYEYEVEEDEQDVSYEVALVSCIVSLAIGFGTGYLV